MPQIVRQTLAAYGDSCCTGERQETEMIDEGKLHQFIGQMLSDLGGASSIAMVRILRGQ
jgi:hypothetical protein